MRSLYCVTAAMMLAAGVSARADVVGTLSVSGISNSIRVSDSVVVDATTDVPESASLLSPVDTLSEGNSDSPQGDVCLIAESCDDSTGADDANAVGALGLQTESVMRGAEPSSVALLGTGLLGFAAVMRRRFLP